MALHRKNELGVPYTVPTTSKKLNRLKINNSSRNHERSDEAGHTAALRSGE